MSELEHLDADEIIDRYAGLVYRIALSQSGSRFEADDIFQEVFLRFFRKERNFKSEEHRKAWLIRVTMNCSYSSAKKWSSPNRIPIESRSAGVFHLPEENMIHNALCSLPPKYRSVIHLYYFEGMSCPEISETLRVSESAVRMRLTRARGMLRGLISEDGSVQPVLLNDEDRSLR